MFGRDLILVAAVALATVAARGDEPLFQDGRTAWAIYLSPQADPTETFAADELRGALKKISGADFEIRTGAVPPTGPAIVIGTLDHPEIAVRAAALKLSADPVEQVAVYTLDGRLYLAGSQPRGALYAVYCFLQRELGVRWLWPGADGEFMPARQRWTLPGLRFNQRPGFAYRGFHLCGDWRDVAAFREWMGRNFINIHRHAAPPEDKRRGFYSLWSSHNVVLPKALFAEHPEYFAEIDGKRYDGNVCFSHPEVDRLVAEQLAAYLRKRPYVDLLSVYPSDNQDYCRCARCARVDVSTAWFEFYNRLTDALRQEFPALKFATIAYQGYRDVPQCQIRNSEFVEYASYSRCNIHPYGHTDCRHNAQTMQAMLAWKATGLPLGNYAYEYDIYSRNCRFVPFLSMIADAVKTSHRLGHVALIPEVSLSPKGGPDVYAHAIQNRLSLYLYARLLWQPDQELDDLLRDWCQTVFGPAAQPMQAYYAALDRAWSGMKIHATILGDALSAAPTLVTDDLCAQVAAAFASAAQRIAGIEDPSARERAAAALQRERALFSQWQDLARLGSDAPQFDLPRVAAPAALAEAATRHELAPAPLVAAGLSTQVQLGWTDQALLVHWTCRDPQLDRLRAAASGGDAAVATDDSVELTLESGASGETWRLAVTARGVQSSSRDSSVGVREDDWNPTWSAHTRVDADRWQAEMTVPFAALGLVPNANESWQARFVRRYGGGAAVEATTFPEHEPAVLWFRAAARTDRPLLWWSGAPDREAQRNASLRHEFGELGWQIHIVSDAARLQAGPDRYAAYWFRHPEGPHKVPADYWASHLAPAVRGGALAVFVSFWPIHLDRYFDDPALKVQVVSCGKIPLAGRIASFIAPGDWGTTPHNLVPRLRGTITPAYGFVPAEHEGWTVLATAPSDTQPYPFLLTRRYGQGMIVLAGDDLRVSPAELLENFAWQHEHASDGAPPAR